MIAFALAAKSALGFLKGLNPLVLVIVALMLFAGWQWRSAGKWKGKHAEVAATLKLEQGAHKQTVTNYRAASAKAMADAQANKARVETRYVEIKDEHQTAIVANLRSELERVRARATAANSGSANATGVSGTAGAAGDPFGRDRATIVHDAEICTANTLNLEGWQGFYSASLAVPTVGETR